MISTAIASTRHFFFFVGLCAAHVSHKELSPPGRLFRPSSSALRRSVFEILGPSSPTLISADSSKKLVCGSLLFPRRLPARRRESALVKDKILCFVCAVNNIERTFNTYYELQEHLYRDHDMKRDPAMDIFNKYKPAVAKTPTAEQ